MSRKAKKPSSPARYRQQTLLAHLTSSPIPTRGPTSKVKTSTGTQKRERSSDWESNESDSDVVELPTHPSLRIKRAPINREESGSDSSDVGKIKFEPETSSAQSDEGDALEVLEIRSPTQAHRAKRRRVVESDAEGHSDVSSELRGVGTRWSAGKKRQRQICESESDSGSPGKQSGRLVKGMRPLSPEEPEDILDGIDEEKIVNARLRGQSSKKATYLKNLERLKRKKKGQAPSESEGDSSGGDMISGLIPGARPSRSDKIASELSQSEEDSGDESVDGFIVDDGDTAHMTSLPAAFSMNTHQDLAHHFKIVCQFLAYLAVSSPQTRTRVADRLAGDEYFSIPLTIARRKIADVRDSIVSSVWRPAYKRALRRYPKFELSTLDFAIPQCDACHLGGRMSKFVGRLGGSPYDPKSFQAIEPDGSDGSDDDPDQATSPEFHLGRFCARRTETFHELSHWERELFHELLREVEELAGNSREFARVAFAGGIKPPDDLKDADQIMDWLDQRGVIASEWLKVKQLMSKATNLEADVKRGGEDDY